MSSVASALPPEISSPLDNVQIPDDCVSYTLRGDVTAPIKISCRGCRRVTGDPHQYCIRHLLDASLPVCTKKSRCSYCSEADNKFWLRYMKSYYGHCQHLSEENFDNHLAI